MLIKRVELYGRGKWATGQAQIPARRSKFRG